MATLDTSMYNVRPRSMEEFSAIADAAENSRAAVQSNRLKLALQEREMKAADAAAQDQADLRRALQGLGPSATDDDVIGLLRGRGLFGEASKVEANALDKKAKLADIAKKDVDADKDRLANGISFLGVVGQVMGGVRDQSTYDAAKQVLAQNFGADKVAAMPPSYDQQAVSQKVQQALSVKDRLEQEWKTKGYALDQRKQTEVERNNQTQNRIAQGNLGVAQANVGVSRERLALEKNAPRGAYDAERGVIVDTRTGQATPVVSADGKPLAPKSRSGPMSATLQKELLESDDTVQAAKNTVLMLESAKKLNKEAYSGYFAKGRATLASNLPGESKGADATIEIDNLMTGQGLESLKSIFGAAPTEGERKILMEMQASVDKTPAQREAIMDRAISAAKRRSKYASDKAGSIRSGKYLTDGAEVVADVGTEQIGGLSSEEQAELDRLRAQFGRKQ